MYTEGQMSSKREKAYTTCFTLIMCVRRYACVSNKKGVEKETYRGKTQSPPNYMKT